MNMFSHHSQVHPEGKFVVDVDKNIDINDVSITVVLIVWMVTCQEYLNSFAVVIFTVAKQNNKKRIYCQAA